MITHIIIIYFVGAFITFFFLVVLNAEDEQEIQRNMMLTIDEYYDKNSGRGEIASIVVASVLWFVFLPFFVVVKIMEEFR